MQYNDKLMPFHLAIPVDNLERARNFYKDILGCTEGRSDTQWVDFNFFGHQLVIHATGEAADKQNHFNRVDNHGVPIPHFGMVLAWSDWESLADKLKSKDIKFIIEPYIRFKGQAGEQATMFILDPCGNAIEFKSFKNIEKLFAK